MSGLFLLVFVFFVRMEGGLIKSDGDGVYEESGVGIYCFFGE